MSLQTRTTELLSLKEVLDISVPRQERFKSGAQIEGLQPSDSTSARSLLDSLPSGDYRDLQRSESNGPRDRWSPPDRSEECAPYRLLPIRFQTVKL